jgi:hypothetical protein
VKSDEMTDAHVMALPLNGLGYKSVRNPLWIALANGISQVFVKMGLEATMIMYVPDPSAS